MVKRVVFLGISKEEVETWICAEEFDKGPNYDLFYSFITKIACINDNAERNIRLIQDFVAASKKEDHRQEAVKLQKYKYQQKNYLTKILWMNLNTFFDSFPFFTAVGRP